MSSKSQLTPLFPLTPSTIFEQHFSHRFKYNSELLIELIFRGLIIGLMAVQFYNVFQMSVQTLRLDETQAALFVR